ncbi:MAG: hypothetical protein ACK5I7_02665 [Anaerotignum sp.]
MTLSSKTDFTPIEVECVVNQFTDLNSVLREKLKRNLNDDMNDYQRFFNVGEKYFIYGIEINIYGKVNFLESRGYGSLVPAWLFSIDYKIPKNWYIKSYLQEQNIVDDKYYEYMIPALRMGFKEFVFQSDFIFNLYEREKKEIEIFNSYQEYEKNLLQKIAEKDAVKGMYPYQGKNDS